MPLDKRKKRTAARPHSRGTGDLHRIKELLDPTLLFCEATSGGGPGDAFEEAGEDADLVVLGQGGEHLHPRLG